MDTEHIYKMKIKEELLFLLMDREIVGKSLEEAIEDAKEGIKIHGFFGKRAEQHPQKISKKRELELYLKIIDEKIYSLLEVSTDISCQDCAHNSLYINHEDLKCNKGHSDAYPSTIICPDYESLCSEERRRYHKERIQYLIKLFTELKKQKQSELEQYQERKEQINLQRRLR